MKLDARLWLPPLLALAMMVVIGARTSDALRRSGAWARASSRSTTLVADPYARLDHALSRANPPLEIAMVRDPFAYGAAPVARVVAPRRPATVSPQRPVLTAIVADEDPRAVIHWGDRYYTVKAGDQVGSYRVATISSDQVVLESGSQRLVLRSPSKGD